MIRSFIRKTFSLAGYDATFRPIGYEIKRKNLRDIFLIRESQDEALEQLKFIGYNPDLIIDVGAADGTPPLQNAFPGSHFFWIEPLQKFEPALKNLQQKLRGDYLITAVGSSEGSFLLNVHEDLHGSMLLNEIDGKNADGTQRQIPVTTVSKLSTNHNWKARHWIYSI